MFSIVFRAKGWYFMKKFRWNAHSILIEEKTQDEQNAPIIFSQDLSPRYQLCNIRNRSKLLISMKWHVINFMWLLYQYVCLRFISISCLLYQCSIRSTLAERKLLLFCWCSRKFLSFKFAKYACSNKFSVECWFLSI